MKSILWNIRKQKTTKSKQEEKKIQKNEDSISCLWEKFKRSNMCILGVPGVEKKKQEIVNLFE